MSNFDLNNYLSFYYENYDDHKNYGCPINCSNLGIIVKFSSPTTPNAIATPNSNANINSNANANVNVNTTTPNANTDTITTIIANQTINPMINPMVNPMINPMKSNPIINQHQHPPTEKEMEAEMGMTDSEFDRLLEKSNEGLENDPASYFNKEYDKTHVDPILESHHEEQLKKKNTRYFSALEKLVREHCKKFCKEFYNWFDEGHTLTKDELIERQNQIEIEKQKTNKIQFIFDEERQQEIENNITMMEILEAPMSNRMENVEKIIQDVFRNNVIVCNQINLIFSILHNFSQGSTQSLNLIYQEMNKRLCLLENPPLKKRGRKPKDEAQKLLDLEKKKNRTTKEIKRDYEKKKEKAEEKKRKRQLAQETIINEKKKSKLIK
jgi:hypothetical protein